MTKPPAIAWLRLARLGWLAFFALALGTFLIALPARWDQLVNPGSPDLPYLAALGWPIGPHAVFSLATEIIFTVVFLAVALVIFARRSDDRMALFTALVLVAFGVGNQNITLTVGALRSHPVGQALFQFFAFAAWASFTQFAYLFPSGRYVPRWTLVTGLVWFLITIPWNFMVGSPLDPLMWPIALAGPLILGLYVSFVVAQIYRFTRVSNAVERQQTKWVFFALALIVGAFIVEIAVLFRFGSEAVTYLSTTYGAAPSPEVYAAVRLTRVLFLFIFLLLPISLAFSILRYRLWDIDLLIRRTLIYSVLTGLLALVYFGTVLIIEGVLRGVVGGDSPLAIVLSTLVIAALFVPLRSRVQRAIDRRFFRRKYDAARTLAAFGAQARDETDLGRLSARLQQTVQDTTQPAHVSLWVRPDKRQE
jgi:hypothetical protein